MSVLGTEMHLNRWAWAAAGCVGLAYVTTVTTEVTFPLPIALRLISAPEVLALIAVVLSAHPLLDRLPQFSPTAARDRRLRPVRVMVGLLLIIVALAPGAGAIPHLLGFGLGLWAVAVLVIVAGFGSLAWMVPVIGGMAMFIADGGVNAPISTTIATPGGAIAVTVLVLVSCAAYSLRGPATIRTAHA